MTFGTLYFVLYAKADQFCLKFGFQARTQNKANETLKTKQYQMMVLAPRFVHTLLAVPPWGPWDIRRQ